MHIFDNIMLYTLFGLGGTIIVMLLIVIVWGLFRQSE